MMRRIDWLAVTALLLFASSLRILGISYGQLNPEFFPSTTIYGMVHDQLPIHPDEYTGVSIPVEMVLQRRLNPNFFEYPSFIINTNFVMFQLTGATNGLDLELRRGKSLRLYAPFSLYVVSRMYSVFGGLLMVTCAYAISRMVAGRYAALCAGLLTAVSYTLVQHAHYVKPGTLATGWMMLATWASFAALYAQRSRYRIRFYLLAGVVAGLAITTRYNAGIVLLIVFLVGVILGYRNRTRKMLRTIFVTWLLILVVFLIGSPYVVIDFENFWRGFIYIVGQFTTTGAYVPAYFLTDSMNGFRLMLIYLFLFAIGIPAGIYAIVGLLYYGRERPRSDFLKQNSPLLIALIIAVMVVAYIGITFRTIRPGHSDNVMILVLPFIAMLAGFGANALVKMLPMPTRFTMPLILLMLIIQPLVLSVQVVTLFTQRDTRHVMLDWIHDYVPEGSRFFLNGPYNVPLDEAIYPNNQQFGRYATTLPDGDNYDYMVYSDAVAFDILRSTALVPPDVRQYQRDYVRNLDQQFTRVVEIKRPVWLGSGTMMNNASYWHHPGLVLYCLNPQSCEAIGA